VTTFGIVSQNLSQKTKKGKREGRGGRKGGKRRKKSDRDKVSVYLEACLGDSGKCGAEGTRQSEKKIRGGGGKKKFFLHPQALLSPVSGWTLKCRRGSGGDKKKKKKSEKLIFGAVTPSMVPVLFYILLILGRGGRAEEQEKRDKKKENCRFVSILSLSFPAGYRGGEQKEMMEGDKEGKERRKKRKTSARPLWV